MTASASPAAERRPSPTGFDVRSDFRQCFWAALAVAWDVTTNPRQAWCCRVPARTWRDDGTAETCLIAIEKRPHRDGERANFSGLFRCGINGCPMCGPKIAAERAADIAAAITSWYAQGGRVAFSTWTLEHHRGDRLAHLVDLLALGLQAARGQRGKGQKKLRDRLRALTIGEIQKLESTVGPANGWHPHRHGLTFLKPGVTDDQAAELDAARFDAYRAELARHGVDANEEKGHDFTVLDLGQAHEKIGQYVAKAAGHELAAAGTKRARGENRTPLELLLDLGHYGHVSDLALWQEHEQAMKGRRVLRWSPGLRQRLIGDLPEKTDQEAAESNDGQGRLIGVISEPTWRKVCRTRGGPARLLRWAESYDDDEATRDLLGRKLAEHGLGQLLQAGRQPAQTGDPPESDAV